MWDFSILLSIRLMLRTMPFLVLRLVVALLWGAVLAAAGFAGVLVLGIVAGWNEGAKGALDPRIWLFLFLCALVGVGLILLILRWLHKWALYRVKAAHIAVLVEYVQGRELPKGMGQIRYGRAAVRARFGAAAAFFVLDEMIRAALGGVDRITNRLTASLPRRMAAMIVAPIHLILHFAVSLADEMMLAHAMDARSQDAGQSTRRALSIYAASQGVILKNAFWLSVLAAGLGALVWFGAIAPVWTEYQAARTPETLRSLLVATVGAVALTAAFFGPFALICMVQVWFRGVLGNGDLAQGSARDEPITPLFGRSRASGAARALPDDGPRNGDIV